MALVREDIDLAVLAELQPLLTAGTLKTLSRKWKIFSDVRPKAQPALFIVKAPERDEAEEGTPTKRTMTYDLNVYTNGGHGTSVIPATALNNMMDAVNGALAGSPVDGINTLGGKVAHAYINGVSEIYEGTLGDQAVAIMPLEVLLNTDNLPGEPFLWFNSGTLFAFPKVDADGSPYPTPVTPVRMGTLKGITMDVSTDTVEPSSQLQYKFDMAWNLKSVTGTARIASINARMWNQIFFGQDLEAGGEHIQIDEESIVPATPFQITVTPPASGTFLQDLGVFLGVNGDADDGQQMVRVAAAPAAGEYTVNGSGTYTFNSAKEAKEVIISYLFSTASGNQLNVTNRFTQKAPRFAIYLTGGYNGRQITWSLPVCVTKTFALPTAVENFAVQDFVFEALDDGNGLVANISLR